MARRTARGKGACWRRRRRLGIRAVLDDEVLAVDEAVGAGWKRGFVNGMANAVARTVSCFIVVSSKLVDGEGGRAL